MTTEPDQPRDLVVIGASAGGIDALSRLVATLPEDFPAPIVVAQHLERTRISHLEQILDRRSELRVRSVHGHEALAPGVIYVVPANHDVEITSDMVRVVEDGPGRSKPSIDRLLETAATVFGERLIAVILTGTGSDGAEGARRVKEAGGTVIVQDPETAQFPGLPRSLAPTVVDIVADLDAIGALLRDLLTGISAPTTPSDERQMKVLLEQVRQRSAIDFSRYRQPTIRRRLQRRMADTGRSTLEEYNQYLRRHPDEYDRLVASFLIKVTDFFRDADVFDHLRQHILPELIQEARDRDNEIRIWSAGCATGEEAYSLAMLLADFLGHELDAFSIRIFATDIDPQAVAYARRGVYPPAALDDIPSALRTRYFTQIDGDYEVKKSIRRLVVFAPHDLGQRAPFPRIDLALCRNVLIYFTPELQRRALQLFAFALRPTGRLILGKSETTSPLPEHFTVEDARLKVYRRRGERVLIPPAEIRTQIRRSDPGNTARADLPPPRAPRMPRTTLSRSESAEQLLLDLPIGVVVVDRRYDIQAINAAARRLLNIYSTAIGEDLVHLARRFPAELLHTVIDRAFEGRSVTEHVEVQPVEGPAGIVREIEVTCFPRRTDTGRQTIEHAVLLISDLTPAEQDMLVDEPSLPPESEAIDVALDAIGRSDVAPRDLDLAQAALTTARSALESARLSLERLRAEATEQSEARHALLLANRELAAATTDLRAQNDEFLLASEEAQAAMEEVETLSEEQQASNEELETLNEELQATIEELNTTNDDLEARSVEIEQTSRSLESERSRLLAVLTSMGEGVLVVDRSGRTVLTNTAFDQMFGEAGAAFVPEDEQGRPLPPAARPQRRAALGETFNLDFTMTSADGTRRWFEASGRPVENDGHECGALVIRDTTDRGLLRLQDEFLAMASHELRTPLTALYGNLQLYHRRLERGEAYTDVRASLLTAMRQVEHLRILVDDLLDAGRLCTGHLTLRREPTNLVDLVNRVVGAAEALTHDMALQLTTQTEPIIVQADPVRLEQVLLNLISNAREHANGTAQIDITLRQVEGTAEIDVRDYGSGIPAHEVDQLFSRFYQVARPQSRSARKGLGLGLYIAREIVTEHGGTLGVESQEGQGSRFFVRLPLHPPAPTN